MSTRSPTCLPGAGGELDAAADSEALGAARANGTLVARASQWGPLYYDTAVAVEPDAQDPSATATATAPSPGKKNAKSSAGSWAGSSAGIARADAQEKERLERLAAKTAHTARRAAAAQMVRVPPETGEAAEALVRWAVHHRGANYDRALLLVHEWLKHDIYTGKVKGRGGRDPVPIEDPDEWETAIVASGDTHHAMWLAWAIAVAVDEIRTSRSGAAWDRATRDYYELLKKRADYDPTLWEMRRLDPTR